MNGDEVILDPYTHTYTVNGMPVDLCVSDVIELAGIKKPYPPEAAQHVEHARLLGNCLHRWCEHIDLGGEFHTESHGTEVEPYIFAWASFLEDNQPEWTHVEESFYKEGIAGTPDRIGLLKDQPVILDIKSPKKAEPHWGIQLTAYKWLTDYPVEYQLWVCWLHSDGTYKLLNYTPELEIWKAAVTLAKWQRR